MLGTLSQLAKNHHSDYCARPDCPLPPSIREGKIDFHLLYLQAEDQIKAAIKNRYQPLPKIVHWTVIIGPYWTPVTFGPFSDAELTAFSQEGIIKCILEGTIKDGRRDGGLRSLTELYLLYEDTSLARLHQLLAETDRAAQSLINALQCEFRVQHLYDDYH